LIHLGSRLRGNDEIRIEVPMKLTRPRYALILLLLLTALETLTPPSTFIQPVTGATRRDWHPRTFWYSPWGRSGVHKGIGIFARHGTPVVAAQSGLVLYSGQLALSGNVVLTLTPRGWLHYHAHLDAIRAEPGQWLPAGAPVGTVGASGNAAGKPAHLHYSVITLAPRPWETRWAPEGWRRMFYRDPGALLQ
jgi:murein DD-endopeptidase MepM/ murein hydrolase activator NlpD